MKKINHNHIRIDLLQTRTRLHNVCMQIAAGVVPDDHKSQESCPTTTPMTHQDTPIVRFLNIYTLRDPCARERRRGLRDTNEARIVHGRTRTACAACTLSGGGGGEGDGGGVARDDGGGGGRGDAVGGGDDDGGAGTRDEGGRATRRRRWRRRRRQRRWQGR